VSRLPAPRRFAFPALTAVALAAVLLSSGCATSGEGAAKSPGPANGRAGLAQISEQQLVGLDADQIGRLLGPADFRRDDGPVELWQYRAPDCVLDLYLYNDAATATWRVEHAAARDISATAPSSPACVAGLLQSRHARVAG